MAILEIQAKGKARLGGNEISRHRLGVSFFSKLFSLRHAKYALKKQTRLHKRTKATAVFHLAFHLEFSIHQFY